MGPISCPETSVRNYHYTLCNIPKEYGSLPVPVPSLTDLDKIVDQVFATMKAR